MFGGVWRRVSEKDSREEEEEEEEDVLISNLLQW